MNPHDDKRDALIVKLREHCADITNAINGCEDDETRERTHAFDATHLYFDEFAALLSDAADALSAPSATPRSEPVAWAVVTSDGDPREANSIHWPATSRHVHDGDAKAAAQAWADRWGYSIVPLYAADGGKQT